MDGYVYLIKETTSIDKYYKIGCTRFNDVDRRLRQLQTGNPNSLSLEHAYKTSAPFKLEKMLHNRFSSLRCHGEWFRLDEATVAEFGSICDSYQRIIDSLADNPFFSNKKTEASPLF